MFTCRYISNFTVFPISLGIITLKNFLHYPTKFKLQNELIKVGCNLGITDRKSHENLTVLKGNLTFL